MKFRNLASFGKRIEFWIIGEMIKEGHDVYIPMVDDMGIDAVVRKPNGKFIEVQGTAEGEPFDSDQLDGLVELAEKGIAEIVDLQRLALSHGSD